MAADRDMMNKGYDPLHERLTDIDAPTHQGIDGVFKDPVHHQNMWLLMPNMDKQD